MGETTENKKEKNRKIAQEVRTRGEEEGDPARIGNPWAKGKLGETSIPAKSPYYSHARERVSMAETRNSGLSTKHTKHAKEEGRRKRSHLWDLSGTQCITWINMRITAASRHTQ
jgi:vacuolar-type H+-ATPase subunit H